jgi:hypothetical protein
MPPTNGWPSGGLAEPATAEELEKSSLQIGEHAERKSRLPCWESPHRQFSEVTADTADRRRGCAESLCNEDRDYSGSG